MFPPIQCSKSSYFTQWLISEYLNRVNEVNQETPPTTSQPQPPPPPPPQPHHGSVSPTSSSSSSPFSAKNLRHLFHAHAKDKLKNNNEYKNGNDLNCPKRNIEYIQLLALNALEFTAPIYSFRKEEQKVDKAEVKVVQCKCPSTRTFVQLSGHPGSFAPAGPNTVWKKMPEDQQAGELCGRMQVGSGIGMDSSLRDFLQALNSTDQITTSQPHSQSDHDTQQLQLPNLNTPPNTPTLHPTKTPITVFFNSTSTSSSSSSSPPLLPPQMYDFPTHLLPNETQVYRRVNSTTDPITAVIPKYETTICYNSQMFLELEDLLTNFSQPNPTIMDIKLGTRTFLESEVKNSKPRPDLYQKLIAVDPTACTEEEHANAAVTKLTYMLFREKQSSSNSLGFRVEGIKIGQKGTYDPEHQLKVNFKVLKNESEIIHIFKRFCKGDPSLVEKFRKRLDFIRTTLESSDFFMTHEVIGSSLLFIHDDVNVGVWLIDFAKTFLVPTRLSHRDAWVMGNREDGVLTGVDNIVRLFGECT